MRLLFLSALLLGTGCVAFVGTGVFLYEEGNLKSYYADPYEQVWKAALSAEADLNLKLNRVTKDATEGKIVAENENGTEVKINVKPASPDTTLVKIRVGALGNKHASQEIDTRIRTHITKEKGLTALP